MRAWSNVSELREEDREMALEMCSITWYIGERYTQNGGQLVGSRRGSLVFVEPFSRESGRGL